MSVTMERPPAATEGPRKRSERNSQTRYPQSISEWRQPGQIRTVGQHLDDWVISVYNSALGLRRIEELSGEPLSPKVERVVDFILHGFTENHTLQLAFFMTWRKSGASELSPGADRRVGPGRVDAMRQHTYQVWESYAAIWANVLDAYEEGS